jgi:glucose-1-phosphate thymidylyltransferase
LDAGTQDSLLQAANFIQAVEDRQGLMVSCPEEIAFRMGYINMEQLCLQADRLNNSSYGIYLRRFVEDNR